MRAMNEIDPTGRVILWLFMGFIIAINLGLIFAFRDRNRRIPPPDKLPRKSIFTSREEEPAHELARRVAELRKQAGEAPPDEHDTNGASR